MEQAETLVVGAGPVGLFLAAELRRRGRSCVIIDRERAPSMHSKALAIMPGTMEMFERCGIAPAFANAANRVDGVRFVTPRRSAYVPFGKIQSPYNYVSILPQWKTQQLIEVRLGSLGERVRYGHRLTELRQDRTGVTAVVETPGGLTLMRASYVAGCDGVGSTVRAQAGIGFAGTSYPGTALLADVLLSTDVPVNEARVHAHGGAIATLFPISERMRRVVLIAPGERLPDRAERSALQAHLENAGYAGSRIEEVVWSNGFRVHRKIASAMRCGRIFLAGDSVHTHSPVGGQGMNIGLHDAWDLASKLAPVLSGDASESLLDCYERERLPVARGVLRGTDVLTRALVHPGPLVRIAGLPFVYGPVIRRLSLTA